MNTCELLPNKLGSFLFHRTRLAGKGLSSRGQVLRRLNIPTFRRYENHVYLRKVAVDAIKSCYSSRRKKFDFRDSFTRNGSLLRNRLLYNFQRTSVGIVA